MLAHGLERQILDQTRREVAEIPLGTFRFSQRGSRRTGAAWSMIGNSRGTIGRSMQGPAQLRQEGMSSH